MMENVATAMAADDGAFWTLMAQDAALLQSLDSFFTHAVALQTQRTPWGSLGTDAQNDLETQTRQVFLLYMRALSLLSVGSQWDPAQLMERGAFHITLMAPFCQLYAPKNGKRVQQLLESMPQCLDRLAHPLRDLYSKQLEMLHAAVERVQRPQVVDLIHNLYELSLSLDGLLVSESLLDRVLLNDQEPEATLLPGSLMYSLVVCYEADLPQLQRQVVHFDSVTKRENYVALVAETRRHLLHVFGRFFDALMKSTTEETQPAETLLAVLHTMAHCYDHEPMDQGSCLSDLLYLCGYHDTCMAYFESSGMDHEQVSYLGVILDALPRRRRVVQLSESKKASQKSQSEAKQEPVAAATNATRTSPVAQADDESAAMLVSKTQQVKELLPDLGDGYVELCLISSDGNVERVINFLFEANPPGVIQEIPSDLKRHSAAFASWKAKLTGIADEKPAAPAKLDPTRVWVGKKTLEREYDPQRLKQDHAAVEKIKELVQMYDQEGAHGDDDLEDKVRTIDEYDDDYNDELDDYEPFSVRDGGQTDDQDTIREQNRRMRAREAEEAYWESMKNPNRRAADEEDEEGGAEEEEETKEESALAQSPTRLQAAQARAPQRKNRKEGAGPKVTPSEQEQRSRARNNKNKAKVANHHRKDRALKKMG